MVPQARPFIEVFAERPAVRPQRGKRHPLGAILALACRALLCGSRRSTAIAAWGRYYGDQLVRAFGGPHRSPWAATLHTVRRRVDREAVAAKLGAGAEGLRGEVPRTEEGEEAMAIAGKTLRGSPKQGAPGVPLLSAFAPRLGVTLDALRTQRQMAQQIVDAGGDDVLVGTEHQPQLLEDMTTVFALAPSAGERRTAAATLDLGHGRSEQRGRQTSHVLLGDSAWPGLAQVFHLERQGISNKTGAVREEVVAGVTRLAPERADAARLLALVRGQWQSEHQSHWGREGPFDADRSQGRWGNSSPVMAAWRNTVMGLRRGAGYTNLAAACRQCAAQPRAALHLIGMALEN